MLSQSLLSICRLDTSMGSRAVTVANDSAHALFSVNTMMFLLVIAGEDRVLNESDKVPIACELAGFMGETAHIGEELEALGSAVLVLPAPKVDGLIEL